MVTKKKIEKLGYKLAIIFFAIQIIILCTYREITVISNVFLTIASILLATTTVYKYFFKKLFPIKYVS